MLEIIIAIILFSLSSGFWWPTSDSDRERQLDQDRYQPKQDSAYEMKQLAHEAKEYNYNHYLGGYLLSAVFLLAISLFSDFLIASLLSRQSISISPSPLFWVPAIIICFSSVICGFIPKLYAHARILHANSLQQEAFWIGVMRSLQVLSWRYAIIKTFMMGLFILSALGGMGN
jgi:hypothetical protein